MAATNYEINYDDNRFKEVETNKNTALTELENTYSGIINDSDKYYQAQVDASKEWADKQTQLQQEKTDFAIEQIEQQKEQAKKDYTKEQSGAYVDWQKQSNKFSADAEQKAAAGMSNTGFSESSQVSMWNTYQNRVATARESYSRAVLNYDNAIKDARLQNNSALAEIAYNALQQQLELSLQGFQYKNQLLLDKTNQKLTLENEYYQRYQDVLNQINTENALAEEIRQYNEQMEEERRQFNILHGISSGGSSGGGGGGSSSSTKKVVGSSSSGGNTVSGGSTTKYSTGDKTVDSVLALGYGPISAETLAKKVASGEVKETTKNGVTTFSNSNAGASQARMSIGGTGGVSKNSIQDPLAVLNNYSKYKY